MLPPLQVTEGRPRLPGLSLRTQAPCPKPFIQDSAFALCSPWGLDILEQGCRLEGCISVFLVLHPQRGTLVHSHPHPQFLNEPGILADL